MGVRNGASGACPRCESDVYLTLFQAADRFDTAGGRRFHVVECSQCALIRLDPMPHAEDLASFYPPSYWWESDGSAAGRLAELYRRFVLMDHVHFVTHEIDRSAPILDVGCGGGSLVDGLRRRGLRAYGMDPSGIAASHAMSNYGLTVTRGSLPDAPFAAGTFSAITLCHVLEHVPNPMLILEELAWLLKPGGKLFVQVPNAACWQFLLLGKRWSGLDVPRHLIHFRSIDLEDLLEATGFEVRRRKFFSLRDNPAGLATSIWPAIDPAVRRMRGVRENATLRILKDLTYLALTFAATPFALIEAAGAAGSTVMIEAVRRGGS
jgi:2-polyprenyl-3-methyl-5-hydroxy-6-metoxy-1,4-benzoquinol methylase